ncbi:MAG: hypothetical protein ACRD1R_16820, partial [Acidobacteriota bacterium]
MADREILQEYLHHFKCERNRADKTIKIQGRYWTPFLEQLGLTCGKRLSELSSQQILTFFTSDTQRRGATIGRHLAGVLRSFLRFGVQQGYLQCDLSQALPSIRSY